MIQVIDNVVDERLSDYYNSEMYKIPWYVNNNIAYLVDEDEEIDNIHYGFFHSMIARDDPKIINSPWQARYATILYQAASKCNLMVQEILAQRMFLHCPSIKPGQQNAMHIDLPDPHLVCLYYVNDSDGDTVFFDDNGNEIHRNTPKKNTAVIFDGSIKHCSSTPTGFRCIVNFNFSANSL